MAKVELLAKCNSDGSFSVSYASDNLVRDAVVDFYDEKTGSGYQRNETLRAVRGRSIAHYIQRCVTEGMKPQLFEMTANARVTENDYHYEPFAPGSSIGKLTIDPRNEKEWLSIIDGGTRLWGIENALVRKIIDKDTTFDFRIFIGLTIAEEIAQFLLINENQKKVRTDLSLRVVQRLLDAGKLNTKDQKVLQTVVPDTDAWRYEASRIASAMNSDLDSPWCNRIQMPGETTRSIALQAFFTSLKPLLVNPDIKSILELKERNGELISGEVTVTPTIFTLKVLKNFWQAVAAMNPDAENEPETTVLWAPIGVNACHIALTPILKTILEGPNPNLTVPRFKAIVKESQVANYPFWYTRKGKKGEENYPGEKGEATQLTGAANYSRLASTLEKEWRATLHDVASQAPAVA